MNLGTAIIQVHLSCFQYWRSASISICKLNVNQNCTVILLAGEDDPVAELEGSSELLGSKHKTKQNELNFTLHWQEKKQTFLFKDSVSQVLVNTRYVRYYSTETHLTYQPIPSQHLTDTQLHTQPTVGQYIGHVSIYIQTIPGRYLANLSSLSRFIGF